MLESLRKHVIKDSCRRGLKTKEVEGEQLSCVKVFIMNFDSFLLNLLNYDVMKC